MHTIESEKSKYYKAWTLAYDADSSCGVNHVDEFLRALKTQPNQTVADVGCGNGIATAKLQAQGLNATGIDFVDVAWKQQLPFINACVWDLPDVKFDYVFCTDVFEHLPEDKIDLAFDNIKRIASRGVYFAIATRPDEEGKKINEILHLTVKPLEWWIPRLESRWQGVSLHNRNGQEFNWAGI
jgi:2-polyprenyl-3-methyl-5-hydroxy-6-metoxy-1,4-benzoquinol methylase